MSKIRKSIASTLLIVVFLVLTAMAVVLYGGSDERKEKMESNFFYHQGQVAAETFWAFAWSIANLGSESGQDQSAEIIGDTDEEVNFWSGISSKIKEEWESGGATEVPSPELGGEASPLDLGEENYFNELNDLNWRFLDWAETENGGEIIFRPKNGGEYKLPLPFRSLKSQE